MKSKEELKSEIASLESEIEAWKSFGPPLNAHEGRFEAEEELETAKSQLAALT